MQITINIFISFVQFAMISTSFSLIYYPTKFFHIAHAIILTFSAYFTYMLFQQCRLSLWISIPIAIIFAVGVGVLSELLLYKPLRKRKATSMILMITSLGLYTILQNVISMIWGDDIKNMQIREIKVGHELLGAYITNIQIITVAFGLLLFITTLIFMKYNKMGRNIRAVASNPKLSNIMGINSDKVILFAFALGSTLVAFAGILIAFDVNITPIMGFNWLLYGVVAMIIGGVGSNWGLIGGALLLATSQHLVAYYIGSQWMDAVAYIILILFLIWRPLGFSGKRLKKVEI